MKDKHFKTRRLQFKILEEQDIVYLENLENDEETRRFFPTGAHKNRQQTEAMIKRFMSYYEHHGLPCFLIFDIESKEFVGRCGFGLIDETDEIEAGYVLHKKFWGQGYATEALTALIQWAKENINTDYLIAYAPKDHYASLKVMEKSGMEYYKTDVDKIDNAECQFYRIKING